MKQKETDWYLIILFLIAILLGKLIGKLWKETYKKGNPEKRCGIRWALSIGLTIIYLSTTH